MERSSRLHDIGKYSQSSKERRSRQKRNRRHARVYQFVLLAMCVLGLTGASLLALGGYLVQWKISVLPKSSASSEEIGIWSGLSQIIVAFVSFPLFFTAERNHFDFIKRPFLRWVVIFLTFLLGVSVIISALGVVLSLKTFRQLQAASSYSRVSGTKQSALKVCVFQRGESQCICNSVPADKLHENVTSEEADCIITGVHDCHQPFNQVYNIFIAIMVFNILDAIVAFVCFLINLHLCRLSSKTRHRKKKRHFSTFHIHRSNASSSSSVSECFTRSFSVQGGMACNNDIIVNSMVDCEDIIHPSTTCDKPLSPYSKADSCLESSNKSEKTMSAEDHHPYSDGEKQDCRLQNFGFQAEVLPVTGHLATSHICTVNFTLQQMSGNFSTEIEEYRGFPPRSGTPPPRYTSREELVF